MLRTAYDQLMNVISLLYLFHPGVVIYTFIPSTWETEASRVQSKSAFHRELPAGQYYLKKGTEKEKLKLKLKIIFKLIFLGFKSL